MRATNRSEVMKFDGYYGKGFEKTYFIKERVVMDSELDDVV